CERGNAFDGDDLARKLREHRGLVARARSHVEYALVSSQRQQGADRGDDERLRDGLPLADGKRPVVVRVAAEALRHEELAGHTSHRLEHAVVGDAARTQLAFDHLRARAGRVDRRAHFASERSPAKRAAWRPRRRNARTGTATASAYPATGISATRQINAPSAARYAPVPKRVAPRRRAPVTTTPAPTAPRTATVWAVSPTARPIAPPTAAPITADAPMPKTFEPRMPVTATASPRESPRQSPIVYQLPTRGSVEPRGRAPAPAGSPALAD